MEVIVKNIPYAERGTEFTIIPLGDAHIGSAHCQEAALEKTIAFIKDTPHCYWLGMGDMVDAIGRNNGDKRSQESHLAKWLHGVDDIYTAQRRKAIELLEPIGPKCLAYLEGNHEYSAMHHQGVDMYYTVAEKLSKEKLTLGPDGFIKIQFRFEPPNGKPRESGGTSSVPLVIYGSHGYGGGRKAGGKALKLEEMTRSYGADVYLLGHLHSAQALRGSKIEINQKGVVVNKQWVATITGTYLDGHTDRENPSYARRAGYPPTGIGSPEIKFLPYHARLRVLW